MKPLVSVIIPTHNRVLLLQRAVDSVLRQDYINLQCIVVDDASTDETPHVVQQYTDKRLIYLRHEYSQHASVARNTGIRHAKGDFIAFLDDDDEWLPEKLTKQIRLIQNLPSVGLVYCWFDYYAEAEKIGERHPTLSGWIFKYTLTHQPIGNSSTLLVRRSVINQVGGFDENLPRGNDGDFIRRVCREYQVDFIPEVLVKVYVKHGHVRISQFNEQGIRNAIVGHSAKLDKFPREIKKYPKQAASLYATLAYHYSQLGEWRSSFLFYRKAITTCPFVGRIYLNMLFSLRYNLAKRNG